MVKSYVPDVGDIVWMDFNPQLGREQAGRRPAVILSKRSYNQKAGLVLCCPLTSKVKDYPFEVVINANSSVLADHVKSLDWTKRNVVLKERIASHLLLEVKTKVALLLELEMC